MINLQALYDDITTLSDTNKSEVNYGNLLRFKAGNIYTVRLLPNIKSPKDTFLEFNYQGWNSNSTGNYVEFVCPTTFSDPSPIYQASWEEKKRVESGEVEYDEQKKLWRKTNWLANVYVINDPTTPENNDKVMILRMGKQLKEKIDAFWKKPNYKTRIFDLSSNGCDFEIDVSKNEGGYNSYINSTFSFPGPIAGIGDDQDKIEELYNSVHDLTAVYPIKSYNELKAELNKHYFERSVVSNSREEDENTGETDEDGQVPFVFDKPKANTKPVTAKQKEASKPVAKTPKAESIEVDGDGELDVDELLKGL